MKILSDMPFDIKDYYGDIVIVYPEDARATVKSITDKLDLTGHVYHTHILDRSSLTNRNYVNDMQLLLNGCSCFVPVFTSALFAPENMVYRSMMWFFIGYMRAKSQDAIVPFVPNGEELSLSGTPLQGLDIMSSEEAFLNTLVGKYSSRLLCHNYYKNRKTNLYASKRIIYHCLKFRFKIYNEAFQNAKYLYKEYTSRRMNDAAFDAYIEDKLICGCKIISFGADEKLEPQMMIYKDEVHPDIDELPSTLMGKKIYRKLTESETEESGIRAELTVDVLVPVHKLLGAYIKTYLTFTDPNFPVQATLALMEGDFTDGDVTPFDELEYEKTEFWRDRYPYGLFIDEKLDRLYFSLDTQKPAEKLRPDPSLRVGDVVDYIYPQ